MIFYQTSGRQFSEITPVEVEKETELSIFIKNGTCYRKISDWTQYHKSHEEAKQFVVDRVQKQLNEMELKVIEKRQQLKNALNL